MSIYKIYCDESRQNEGKYMLVGGIWILKEEGWNFVHDFENYCSKVLRLEQPLGHMKWSKVPPTPSSLIYKAYEALVDIYFDYNNADKMFFRVLIVERKSYDFKHPRFYSGDYEEGFYNLYCQLILNCLRKNNEYHIRVAKRNIKKAFPTDCEELRLMFLKEKINERFKWKLNKHWKIYGFRDVNPPVKTIEARSAKERRLIQLADILMGAVGFYWNGEHSKTNPRLGKITLAQHIAKKLGRNDLLFTTGWNDRTFNVFFFDTTKSVIKN